MIDLKSVSITGAFDVGRARVLWQDGVLKVWSIRGHVMNLHSEQPRHLRGYLARWEAKTERGTITLRGKCVGCGGRNWWKFLLIGSDELWSRA